MMLAIRTGSRLNRSVLVAVIVIALVVLYVALDLPASQAYADLRAQFDAFRPPPGATLVSASGGHKPLQASFGATYRAASSYEELRRFYDVEFSQQGWRFIEEQPTADPPDGSGRIACYARGDYRGILQYVGNAATNRWTFALDLTWKSGLCTR